MKQLTVSLPDEFVKELRREAMEQGVELDWLLATVARLGLQLYQGEMEVKVTEE